MFSHLDDPDPPTPTAALASRLVAEGQRRRRRRARVVSGALAGAVIVASAVVLGPWADGDDERGVIADGGTTSTTVSHESTSSTTAPPTTEGTGGLESIVVPGDWPSAPVFAAVTLDGDVVLADPRSGEALLTLLPADPLAPALDVSLAPDDDAVYVAIRSDLGSGPLLRLRPGEPVSVIGTAEVVAVSPDGGRLATVAGDGYYTDEVRVLDAESGATVSRTSLSSLLGGPGGLTVRDVAWDARGDRLLVEAGFPEVGSEVFVVDPETSAQRLGPSGALAAVPGMGWGLGGPVTDEDIVVVETCCSLDANSYQGDSALVVVELATGTEVRRVPFDGGYGEVAVGPSGDWLVLTGCCGAPDARLLDGDLHPLGGPVYAAIDW